jgi:uncharacterized protein (DUF2384 family)
MRQPFRKARPLLPADAGERQGRAVNAARAAFGSTEAVLAFLNSPHPDLGGRPLDLALASDEGLEAVEAAIAAQAGRATSAAAA